MVVDKLFEFIEDIERFCINHRWSRFFNDWESGDEALDEYAMIYKNCCNDVDEEKDAANDIFTELTEYMDCLYNYIDVDCVKVLDDEKQNARKWLDKVEKVIGSCVFSLKGNDLKGFLIKGYQMCHLIKEAAVKTPDEYYGGRRTDVMPYYIGENKKQVFDNILNESAGKLNEKRIELSSPYPVKKADVIDYIERSSRLVYTATDDKTIQLYIYSNGSDRPEAFAEVEITSVGYILHGAEGYDYQGNSLKEFEDDLRNIIFHFDSIMSKRFGENKEQLFDSILNEAISPRFVIRATFDCDGVEKKAYYNSMLDNWVSECFPKGQEFGATQFKNEPSEEKLEYVKTIMKEGTKETLGCDDPLLVKLEVLTFLITKRSCKLVDKRAWLGEGLDNPRFVGGSSGSRWFNWDGDIKSPEPVYHYLGVVHEADADYYVDKYGETTESRFAAVEFDTKEEAIEAAKKAMIFDGTPDYEKVDREFKKVNESDDTYKAKVAGKGWLKGQGFTDKKADADTFESKTEPTQRINQMKKDGKINKNAKPSVVKESLQFFESKEFLFEYLLEAVEDFPRNTRAMYRFAKRRHDDTGAIRKVSKQPYWVHPEGVAKIVMEHGGSDIEIKAAMAHDVLEDTGESYEDMVEKIGEKVASIVKEVTNDKDEIAKVGKEKYISEELCRLSPEALTVKLADMLYNMKDSPTEKNYERMRKNIAFLMMNRQLDGKHLELAQEIMEV